jgi:hypothetical protein
VADFGTIALSTSTALALQAAYFVVLRYPDVFAEKVSAMAIFHENHFGRAKEAGLIFSRTQGPVDILTRTYSSYSTLKMNDEAVRFELIDKLEVEAARLHGYRGCNDLTDSLVTVLEETVQAAINRLRNPSEDLKRDARAIQIGVLSIAAASEIYAGKILDKDIAYKAEMQSRQSSIEVLTRTNLISMCALQGYLIVIALWCGYSLHVHGLSAIWTGAFAILVPTAAVLALRRAADNVIGPTQKILQNLREQNARRK